MPSTFVRYLIRELLASLLLALSALSILMLLVGLAYEAIREGVGLMTILRLIPYALPNALRFAVPAAMLFAVCTVFGKMSSANEFMALKSVGIHPGKLIAPTLVVSLFVSVFAVWLNDVAVSWGRRGVDRIILESVEQIAYGMLRSKGAYSTKTFSIKVRGVEGRQLIAPRISINPSNGKQVTVKAASAELKVNTDRNTLNILLVDSEIERGNGIGVWPGEFSYEVPLTVATRKNRSTDGPSNLSLARIRVEIPQQREKIETSRRDLAVVAGQQLLTGDLERLLNKEWNARYANLLVIEGRLHRLRTEPWRRFASGFSCFFFALVGAPYAAWKRTADFSSSFGTCFLPILVVYYPFFLYGVSRAKAGALPPYSVWLANLALALVGYWFIRKMVRN